MENWKKIIWNCTLYLNALPYLLLLPYLLSPSREPSLCWGLAVFWWVLLLPVDRADELEPEPDILRLQGRIPGCDQKPGGSGTSDLVSWPEVWIHWCGWFNCALSFRTFWVNKGTWCTGSGWVREMAAGPGSTTLCRRRGEWLKASTRHKIFRISRIN